MRLIVGKYSNITPSSVCTLYSIVESLLDCIHTHVGTYQRSDFECVIINDCEWCYTSQIAILMIANCQTGKPHPQF